MIAKVEVQNILKNCLLFGALFALVLFVNGDLISLKLMYNEQPTLYAANQTIHSFRDLWDVYLHPKFLDPAIPFFRPSGHFLLYQLITFFFGWHNMQAMFVLSLFFLAAAGFMMVKLYQRLFPPFFVGGLIAFSLYVMQPSLIVSRFTLMHFDYAYVVFDLLATYCFIVFCEKNRIYNSKIKNVKEFHFKDIPLLMLSLVLYFFTITFKEAAIMLGPAFAGYFFIIFYRPPLISFARNFLSNQKVIQIILLCGAVSCLAVIYVTAPWPKLFSHPLQEEGIREVSYFGTLLKFIDMIAYVKPTVAIAANMPAEEVLRNIYFTPLIKIMTWLSFTLTMFSLFVLAFKKTPVYIKSILILIFSSLIYLAIPVLWAAAMPWHLSLTLVFLTLLMGFGVEYFLTQCIQNQPSKMVVGYSIAILMGLTTLSVNQLNFNLIKDSAAGKIFKLNYNAVMNPPDIKRYLTKNSIVVVEDSLALGDYQLGNGYYPLSIVEGLNYNKLKQEYNYYYSSFNPIYSGTLFRWAYLMPELKEESYSFQITNMQKIPDDVLYTWLANYNNIFCLGYDKEGFWFDRTKLFKFYLMIEKMNRHLVVNEYPSVTHMAIRGRPLYTLNLPLPNADLCKIECDHSKQCRGFTYINAELSYYAKSKCHFYSSAIALNELKPCAVCEGFIKKS